MGNVIVPLREPHFPASCWGCKDFKDLCGHSQGGENDAEAFTSSTQGRTWPLEFSIPRKTVTEGSRCLETFKQGWGSTSLTFTWSRDQVKLGMRTCNVWCEQMPYSHMLHNNFLMVLRLSTSASVFTHSDLAVESKSLAQSHQPESLSPVHKYQLSYLHRQLLDDTD